MISVSQDFAPPFKLIAPYFVIGVICFVIASLLLLGFNAEELFFLQSSVLGWVHLFLLGFVMMIIFGAMAQLIPVTLEVGHFSIEFYYIIWPLLFMGTVLMVIGFNVYTMLLPFGGTLVLIAMFIFLIEVFLTLKKVQTFNNVIKALLVSNIFLALGVCVGLVLALSYSGVIVTDMMALLKAHVYLVVSGYVVITIMALSLVLLPMFGLSHNFSQKPINRAIFLMSIGVTLVVIHALFSVKYLDWSGYILSMISLILYCYQIILIYQTRARKENDIYVINLFFSFACLVLFMICMGLYMYASKEHFLIAGMWALFVGFFTFIIIGHMYKIIPFLVWFERFSPLVGKQKVPMLADMIPLKASWFQFMYSALGVLCIFLALLLKNTLLFKVGASFFIVGALFVFFNLLFMIRFK
jgi:hypothetical protein